MSIRIALVGSGKIARTHAQAAEGLPGVVLAAVVNHRPESMAAFAAAYGIRRQYARLEDLLRDGEVDGLVITTPNCLHGPQTIAALEAGVAVLVEKPMAMNAAEAAEMAETSRRTRSPLMVAQCWRFDPEVRWLREQVLAGRLGPIVRTAGQAVHVNWGPPGWYSRKELAGGGALADMGVHAIDTTRFLLGDPQPVSVAAVVGIYYQDADVDDTASLLIRWENGASSAITAGWWQPYNDGPDVALQVFGREAYGQVLPARLVLRQEARGNGPAVDPGFPPRAPGVLPPMYEAQMRYFVDCIREGYSPVPGASEGWTTTRIVDAAYESARHGRTVLL